MEMVFQDGMKLGECKVCHEPIEAKSQRDMLDILNGKIRTCIDCVGLELPPQKKIGQVDYGRYMESSEWARRREKALKAADYACQICKSEDTLNVHHNTYARFGHERDSDLIVLCAACHKLYHMRLPNGHPYRVGLDRKGRKRRG